MTKPNVFTLFALIAQRARRIPGLPDGLLPGEALLGDYESSGLSRKQYRTAIEILIIRGHIKKVETCRTRKKWATGNTTIGTKVKLLSSNVWDINIEEDNEERGHRGATEGPPMGHEQEGNKKEERKKQQQGVAASSAIEKKPLVYDCLVNVDIPAADKVEITKHYSEDTARNALEWAITNQNKIRSNMVAFLKMACQKGLKIEIKAITDKTSCDESEAYVNKRRATDFIKKNWSCEKIRSISNLGDKLRIGNDYLHFKDVKFNDLFDHFLKKLL